jgi:hypothetical protein
MGNIAFVASTLPIPILKANLNKWDIDEIVISGKNIEKPFTFLKSRSEVKLSVTPKNRFSNLFFIFIKLFKSSLLKKKIYFFHECCWFNFDFLIDFFKVEAEYFPQVTLSSFIKMESNLIHSRYHKILLTLLKKTDNFIEYKVIEDNNEGYYYVLSKRQYKKNVIKHSIEESTNYRRKTTNFNNSNKILLLVGRETVDDLKIAKVYELIIYTLNNLGYKVCIKNHPRSEARLSLNVENVYEVYDPNLPFELIEEDFLCIIGCASTSLINEGQPSFSILNLIGMEEDNLNLRKSHLTEMSSKLNIHFPINIEELVSQINKLKV